MLSVENFYWVLDEILLKPLNFDCRYHYPFGSNENISAYEFRGRNNRINHHVLFLYDQEPIWEPDISTAYNSHAEAWSRRNCKILANSEHSDIKRTLCKKRDMLDWYFFYHGFVALDWFRDARYIQAEFAPTTTYLNLNHLVSNYRSYRISLVARLAFRGLLNSGINSFHADSDCIKKELSDPATCLNSNEKHLIEIFLSSGIRLPIFADGFDISSTASAHFGYHEYRLWQRPMIHVVNETVFYHQKLHLTEKIFKPIVALRPFILVSSPGNLAYLRSYGFKTFGKWIDESYDHEIDPSRRLDLITEQIQRLCLLTPNQRRDMLADMKSTLDYNKQHFFNDFRRIITNEMIDNFSHCLTQWNNGRWVHRVDIPSDLSSIKDILGAFT